MLGKSDLFRRIPKDPKENVRWRLRLLAMCQESRALRQGIMDACRADVLFWVNAFVVQYNPNWIGTGSLKIGPFITWDFQDQLIYDILDCFVRRRDLLIEKSREMGISWVILIVFDWLFLFHQREKFLLLSRNEEAVDNGPEDSDSLFWKIDHIHEHLPDWMAGPDLVVRRKRGYRHRKTGSMINGQATTSKAGVGGRASAILIDEFSRIKDSRDIYQGTASTADCRIFCSTHFGVGNKFYEMTQDPPCKKVVLHWTKHPDKKKGLYRYNPPLTPGKDAGVEVLDRGYDYPPDFDFVREESPTGGPFPGLRSPWYDKKVHKVGDSRAVAMELDIDPAGSKKQFFDALFISRLRNQYARNAVAWEGDVLCDTDTGTLLGLDEQEGGPLKLWLKLRPDGTPPPSSYGAGADISQGAGSSNSCLTIVDGRTGEKVAAYVSPYVKPERFAAVCVALCWLFKDEEGNGAMFAWEKMGPGTSFGKEIVRMGYRRVYYNRDETRLAPKVGDMPGWYPSPSNKYDLILQYKIALENGTFVNRCDTALSECLLFEHTANGSVSFMGSDEADDPSGAAANHGDRVIADALANKMTTGARRKRQQEETRRPVVGSKAWRIQESEDRLRRETEEEVWVS